MKILYVEDNPVNLSLIQRIALMNKHELVSYDEAEVALENLQKGLQVDLILLDIQLAGEMDGIGFAKEIRKRGWQQPVIAITAYAMLGDKERIIEAGCNDYLPKPLPIAEFLTLLAKYDPAVRQVTAQPMAVATTTSSTPPPPSAVAEAAPSTPVETPTPAAVAPSPVPLPDTEPSPPPQASKPVIPVIPASDGGDTVPVKTVMSSANVAASEASSTNGQPKPTPSSS